VLDDVCGGGRAPTMAEHRHASADQHGCQESEESRVSDRGRKREGHKTSIGS